MVLCVAVSRCALCGLCCLAGVCRVARLLTSRSPEFEAMQTRAVAPFTAVAHQQPTARSVGSQAAQGPTLNSCSLLIVAEKAATRPSAPR
jgi:hypothetical protein